MPPTQQAREYALERSKESCRRRVLTMPSVREVAKGEMASVRTVGLSVTLAVDVAVAGPGKLVSFTREGMV